MEDEPTERTASILTPAQRRHLTGGKEQSAGATRAMFSRIRDRITSGLIDANILWNDLPEEHLERAFEALPTHGENRARRTLTNLLAVLYVGVDDREEFEALLEDAIRQERRKKDRILASVEVTIDIDRGHDVSEFIERWESLSTDEKVALIDENPELLVDKRLGVTKSDLTDFTQDED